VDESIRPLTVRQHQCLAHVCGGHTTDEAAYALCLQPQTVKNYLTDAYRALGVTDGRSACFRFRDLGGRAIEPGEARAGGANVARMVRIEFAEAFVCPPDKEQAVIEAMMNAVSEIAQDFGCWLVGGETRIDACETPETTDLGDRPSLL
jgi:DNA-binding CsgD family transcriptional regulator